MRSSAHFNTGHTSSAPVSAARPAYVSSSRRRSLHIGGRTYVHPTPANVSSAYHPARGPQTAPTLRIVGPFLPTRWCVLQLLSRSRRGLVPVPVSFLLQLSQCQYAHPLVPMYSPRDRPVLASQWTARSSAPSHRCTQRTVLSLTGVPASLSRILKCEPSH